MIYFLDASAFVKRYVREAGSDYVRGLVRRQRQIAISRLSVVEVPAALARRVREGDVSTSLVKRHRGRLEADWEAVRIVEARSRVFELAAEMVWKHPLRGYDAVQLASALLLRRSGGLAVTFVCADARIITAAKSEDLKARAL